MSIRKMQVYQVQGFTPYLSLMKKVNELIGEVNSLNEKIVDLEKKLEKSSL